VFAWLATPTMNGTDPMPIHRQARCRLHLLTPKDHALVLVDFQSQMAFATKSIDTIALRTTLA
jgi:hypothetical protein